MARRFFRRPIPPPTRRRRIRCALAAAITPARTRVQRPPAPRGYRGTATSITVGLLQSCNSPATSGMRNGRSLRRTVFALLIVMQLVACARKDVNPWRVSSLQAEVQCNVTYVPDGNGQVSVVYRIHIFNSGSKTIVSARVRLKPWILPSALRGSYSSVENITRAWSLIDVYKAMPPHAREVFTERSVPTPRRSTMRNGSVPCVLSGVRFSDGKFWSMTPGTIVPAEHSPPPHPL